MPVAKSDADALVRIFKSALPGAYVEPLESEDDGIGMDLPYACAAILARADCASNKGTQGLFLRDSSAQTDVPGAGLTKATGSLVLTRKAPFLGYVFVEIGTAIEAYRTDSFGEEEFLGRFITTTYVEFLDGASEPVSVNVESEFYGYSTNLAVGDAYYRFAGTTELVVPVEIDTVSNFVVYSGASLELDRFDAAGAYFGVFEPDPGVSVVAVPGITRLVITPLPLFEIVPGFDAADVGKRGVFRVRQLNDFLSLSQTQPISGGNGGMLDDRGAEMLAPRLNGETDLEYSTRLDYALDVVSPEAIVRIIDALLGPRGIAWRFLEAADPQGLGGFVWDWHPWDYGTLSRKPIANTVNQIQGAVWLSYSQTRRFFAVAVSSKIELEVGLAGHLWQRLDAARARGVSFRLTIDPNL